MGIDQGVLNFFVDIREGWLTFVMFVITYCGSYMVIIGLTLLSAGSFYIHKHAARILPLFMAVGGSAITTYSIKHLFYRARPIAEALYLETGSSFPSGHATAAVDLYGFLLYTIWRHDKHHLKNPLIILLFALIALVGISRLYLGVHYLSDVLAGYVIALIWLFLAAKLHKYLHSKTVV